MTKAIYFDMDGTIANFYGVDGWLNDLINENTNFFCSGSIVPFKGAKPIKCHKAGGHGAQVFARAFCNSCNPAFVNLGQIY